MEQIKKATSNIVVYAKSVLAELENKQKQSVEQAKKDYYESTVKPEIAKLQKARDEAVQEENEAYTKRVSELNKDYNNKCEELKQKANAFVENDLRIKFDAEVSKIKNFIDGLEG